MNELPPDCSPRASTFITTSTSNSPPLTPTSTIHLPSYATTLSGRNYEPTFDSAASYFELRPPPVRTYGHVVSFRIAVNLNSHLFNIPFPQPEELWLERDVQLQDWMTFINFMIPPREAVQEINATKSKDRGNLCLNDINTGSNGEVFSGEHGKAAGTVGASWQGQPIVQQTNGMHNMRVDCVVREWNENFFLPRGLEIIREVESPIFAHESCGDGLESLHISESDGHCAERPRLVEDICPMAKKKPGLSQIGRSSRSAMVDKPYSTMPMSNPRKLTNVASKGLEKVIKWDQALIEKIMDRDPQCPPSTPCKDVSFYQAVSKGDKSMVKKLIDDGANLNVKDANGMPALFRAVSRGDSSIVKLLVDTPIDANACNAAGETPIYRAVLRGDSTIVKLLLTLPVDTNAKTASGDAPIYRAASRGDSTVVKLLLSKSPSIDVNARAENGKTALYRSVARGDSTIVKLLLASGADINQTVDGDLPISKATSRGNSTMVKMLSKKQEERDSLRQGPV